MSKKNKNNRPAPITPITQTPEVVTEETAKSIHWIGVDPAVKELVKKTAERNKVTVETLVLVSVEALIGSLESYKYNCSDANTENRKAVIGSGDDSSIPVPDKCFQQLNDVGVFFGVRICDLLRDAILSQRWNWQRFQPVNSRNMSSIRMHMFHLEQLGPRN